MEAKQQPATQDRDFSRDERIALVVAAALVRFTGALRDYRRALDAAQQSDRSMAARPRDLERLAESFDRQQRRHAEAAADKLMQRIREHFAGAAPATEPGGQPSATQAAKRRYPPADEQIVAWLVTLVGRIAVTDVEREFVRSCDEDTETARYAMAYAQWRYRAPLADSIGKALVPAATSAFEELLGALLRLWLTLYPDALGMNKTTVTLATLRTYESNEDVDRSAVDDRVRDVLQKPPPEWHGLLERELHIRLSDLTEHWDEVLEVFARRNVLVHRGGHADQDYLARLPRGAPLPAIGEALVTDATYGRRAFELLEHLGISLGVAWLARLVPSGPLPAQQAAEYLYSALKERRWKDALAIADTVVRGRVLGELPGVVQVNWMMARREMGEDPVDLGNEIKLWVPPDDDPDYLIARAALLRDLDDEIALLERRLRTDPDGLRRIAHWPLLDDMAQRSPRVAQLLKQARSPVRTQAPQTSPRHRRRR